MMFKKFTQIWKNKRQKFIIAVVILSLILFFLEQLFGKSGIYLTVILSLFTDIFIFWAMASDLKKNFHPQMFFLPFLYSLACSLFYFLVPARFLTRIAMTSFYAIGLYSLFLSENIFIVSAIRTISLLSSARTVSFFVTLVSYFFLSNVVFSLHLNVLLTLILVFGYTFPLVLHSIWSHTLENKFSSEYLLWTVLLSVCLAEGAFALWFWPSGPTIIALFLTGLFYIFIGLSQNWIDKRLFKSVMWEYLWVAVIVVIIFITFGLSSS